MIGIRFKIPNEYNNFLKQILENASLPQEEILKKIKNEIFNFSSRSQKK